jgi:two-component system, OmpR family, alkaline phosphatase synthesis response regulator PhoP
VLTQQTKPALLVLDLMLPGLDGLEITRRLRAHPDPALSSVYIIMLTARVAETERVVGWKWGWMIMSPSRLVRSTLPIAR